MPTERRQFELTTEQVNVLHEASNEAGHWPTPSVDSVIWQSIAEQHGGFDIATLVLANPFVNYKTFTAEFLA